MNNSESETGSSHSDASNDSKTIRLHITHKQRRNTPDSSRAGRPIPDYGIIQTPVNCFSRKVIFRELLKGNNVLGISSRPLLFRFFLVLFML